MKVICISNMKGGVGKTVTAVALARGLHDQGRRVLLCDLDPQCNASFVSGLNVLETETTLFDVFKGEANTTDAIQPLEIGFDIAMCGLKATAADMTFTQLGRERILAEALKPIQDDYDCVICDTSPSLSLLTTAAATAADYLLIPTTADSLSIQGASQLDAYTRSIRKYCNPRLQVLGILVTMYNNRSVLSKSLEGAIQDLSASMETTVFDTRIRRAQALQDAASTQQDLYTTAAKATAIQDYKQLIMEVLNKIEEKG